MQSKSCVAIFRNRFCGNSPNRGRMLFANYSSRTAEKGSIPEVIAFLQYLIKQLITYRDSATGEQITLEGVGIIKPVGSLHKRHFGVEEKAHRMHEKLSRWDVVAIENQN